MAEGTSLPIGDGGRSPAILVADDEVLVLRTVCDTLRDRGWDTVQAKDGREALFHLGQRSFDLVITDLRMPHATGLEVLREARRINPRCAVILMTAHGSVQSAVQAMRDGAYQYVTKPFELDELMLYVERCLQQNQLEDELRQIRKDYAKRGGGVGPIIARSLAMRRLLITTATVADSEASVLLLGESGTGKEILARAIHQTSPRRDRPFLAVNCSAIPEALAESELFGAVRGAYTGAVEHDGVFLAAHGGTVFLDEIGDLPLAVQAKLLRVLEEGQVQRLGSTALQPTDVRVVTATNRNLPAMVEDREFRDDLFYRLNVVSLVVPPLRDRQEDIPLLAAHFLRLHAENMGREAPALSSEALQCLDRYPWFGNVRELQNVIHRAVVMAGDGPITPEHFPQPRRRGRLGTGAK